MTRQQNIRTIFLFSLSILNIFLALPVFAEDTLTITTYYPSPYGVYRELRAKRIAIGDDYIDGANYTWQDTESGSGEVDFNADLVVEGNVGIGTANPSVTLDIGGAWSGGTVGRELRISNSSDYSILRLGQDSTHNGYLAWYYNTAAASAYLNLATYGGINPLVLQDAGGNVGIGTTSPVGALDIRNSGNSGVRMADANGNVIEGILGGALGTLWLNYTSTGNVLLAHGGGNVGIGITAPTAKLHIGGTAGTDGIRFPDGTLQTTAASLKSYDSGWFAVSAYNTYTVTHNLGTTKLLATVWFAQYSDGSGWCVVQGAQGTPDGRYHCMIVALSSTTATIRAAQFLAVFYTSSGTIVAPTSGYCRVILAAL